MHYIIYTVLISNPTLRRQGRSARESQNEVRTVDHGSAPNSAGQDDAIC
jgi:hypothetical protein